jgi:hypothetical protein
MLPSPSIAERLWLPARLVANVKNLDLGRGMKGKTERGGTGGIDGTIIDGTIRRRTDYKLILEELEG